MPAAWMSTSPDDNNGSKRVVATFRDSLGDAGPYLGLGMQLGLVVAFYTVGGYLLDRWLGTVPWLTLIGAGLGMLAMFIQLVRVTTRMNRRTAETRAERQKRDASDASAQRE